MRWFFLIVIVLLAAFGNCVVFEYISPIRMIAGFAFNVAMVALFVMWRFSYFSSGLVKARGLIVGHALLMLAAGLEFVCIGGSAALSGNCENVILDSERRSHDLLIQLAINIESLGYCRELGFGIALIGLRIASPSIRLFVGMSR